MNVKGDEFKKTTDAHAHEKEDKQKEGQIIGENTKGDFRCNS